MFESEVQRIVELDALIARKTEEFNVVYGLYVAAVKQELDRLTEQCKTLESALLVEAKKYFKSTGDRDMHPAFNVRIVNHWIYDPDQVLAEAEKRGEFDLIRVKKELRKDVLNKALENGTASDWVQAEKTKDVSITLSNLGKFLGNNDTEEVMT